uniref:NAD(+) diphosphatase n=1 Tax=Oryza nivara TaxID=4536 RepID=A0A0E0HKS5_ORYNI
MSIHLRAHAFAASPLRGLSASTTAVSPSAAADALRSLLDAGAGAADAAHPHPHPHLSKILPFRRGRPLARSHDSPPPPAAAAAAPPPPPAWRLAWLPPARVPDVPSDAFVFLGAHGEEEGKEAAAYWAVDVSERDGEGAGDGSAFVDLRTLMVATDWRDKDAMGDLAIAGHARALLEWHSTAKFCGACGSRAVPAEAGRRKQCSNESCKKRIYPRVDPVVIMLVIDKENDRALLSRQSRFVPRMWSCLAGFIEPGESLEEAVRRETWEETGIQVGEVIYHSSQPWPVGPSTMPCQLMVGFFAYAKSLEIHVDKKELEDAQWHSREDVKKALTFAEYEKAQRTNALKVNQICKGVEKRQSISADLKIESEEPAPMFVPGPYAIAHHLISSWVFEGAPKAPSSFSNL